MWGGMAIVFILFMIVVKGGLKTVPGKMQNIAEIFIEFIKGMVGEFIGKEGMKYFPFIATLFFFIMSCNLIGLIPGSYTITSQLVVTGIFATIIFIMTLIIVALFNSVRPSLIMALTVPFALIGITAILAPTQTAFGFMAMLGVLSLIGIVINNAIVLIDFIESNVAQGQPLRAAVAAAGRVRIDAADF